MSCEDDGTHEDPLLSKRGTTAVLGQEATMLPSHHGGFLGGELGYASKPEEFAAKLREVLSG